MPHGGYHGYVSGLGQSSSTGSTGGPAGMGSPPPKKEKINPYKQAAQSMQSAGISSLSGATTSDKKGKKAKKIQEKFKSDNKNKTSTGTTVGPVGLGSPPPKKIKTKTKKDRRLNTPTRALMRWAATPFTSTKLDNTFFKEKELNLLKNNLINSITENKNINFGKFIYPQKNIADISLGGFAKAGLNPNSAPEIQVFNTLGKIDYRYDPTTDEYIIGGNPGGGTFDFATSNPVGSLLNKTSDVIEIRFPASEITGQPIASKKEVESLMDESDLIFSDKIVDTAENIIDNLERGKDAVLGKTSEITGLEEDTIEEGVERLIEGEPLFKYNFEAPWGGVGTVTIDPLTQEGGVFINWGIGGN